MSILVYLPADTSIDQAEHNKEVKVYDKGSFDMARICIIWVLNFGKVCIKNFVKESLPRGIGVAGEMHIFCAACLYLLGRL